MLLSTFPYSVLQNQEQMVFFLDYFYFLLVHFLEINQSNDLVADLLSDFIVCEDFCRYHYLVGLLLQEVRTALNHVVHTRRVAIAVLRDLLAKHELDDRYQSKV